MHCHVCAHKYTDKWNKWKTSALPAGHGDRPAVPAFRKQKGQKFKVILCSSVSCRPSWTIWNPLSQHQTETVLHQTRQPRGAEICACLHIGRVTFAFLVITRLGLVLDFNNCREMNEPNFTDFLLWPYVHMKWQGQNTIYKGISECWILLY